MKTEVKCKETVPSKTFFVVMCAEFAARKFVESAMEDAARDSDVLWQTAVFLDIFVLAICYNN